MTVNKVDITDELWDLELPGCKPRSRLFHIEPIAVGTPYVESLTSYVARLAKAHSVPPGTLLAIEVGPLVKKNYLPNTRSIGAIYGQESVRALNGNRSGALQLVQALEALTLRTDLQFLTMLPEAEVFPSLGLLKHQYSWCPLCYQKWREQGLVIYSPLLWALRVVTVCPYHHQLLQSQCPHCHQEFLPLWRNTQPGYCLRCGGWLGADSINQQGLNNRTNELQWEVWVANTLGELIAQAPHQRLKLPRETIRKALSAYVNEYTDGNISDEGHLMRIATADITRWRSGTSIPKLEQLLKICFALKTNLVEFFQFKVVPPRTKTNPDSSSSQSKKQPKITSSRAAGRKNSRERIRTLLQNLLTSNEYPPPSVREVGRRHHIGLATFYRYAPDLCQTISVRYEEHRKCLQKQAIQLGCSEVRRLAPQLYAQGITPSVKNLSRFMANPAALWQEEVLETLNEVRRSLSDRTSNTTSR